MIHGAQSPGTTLERVNTVLALYYDPDFTDETRAAVRMEFVRALAPYPDWAVQKALDSWASTGTRRPSPGDIVILADRQVDPYRKELARRKAAEDAAEEAQRLAMERRVPGDVAARLMHEAGFTPKRMHDLAAAPMASTFDEAAEQGQTPRIRHWTETATETQLAQLAAARARNPLMQAGRAQAPDHGAYRQTENPAPEDDA